MLLKGKDVITLLSSKDPGIRHHAQQQSEILLPQGGTRMTAWKSFSASFERPRFDTMYQKQKGLAVDSGNFSKLYFIELKRVSLF